MSAKKEKGINLLPQNEFEASTLGRILRWALSTFRFIVIITELVVMVSFLSRFWLDAQNSDLNESIKQKVGIISSYQDIEKKFNLTQKRLKIFSEISKQPAKSEVVKTISSLLPSDVSLSSLSLGFDSAQVNAISTSERGIAQFITNLEAQEQFGKVELSQLASDKENQSYIIFTIILTSKTDKKG
ncbi:MAG: PilN domain-containing protein [bacterium]|nr:PilN domain-containing protein [bacterium]